VSQPSSEVHKHFDLVVKADSPPRERACWSLLSRSTRIDRSVFIFRGFSCVCDPDTLADLNMDGRRLSTGGILAFPASISAGQLCAGARPPSEEGLGPGLGTSLACQAPGSRLSQPWASSPQAKGLSPCRVRRTILQRSVEEDLDCVVVPLAAMAAVGVGIGVRDRDLGAAAPVRGKTDCCPSRDLATPRTCCRATAASRQSSEVAASLATRRVVGRRVRPLRPLPFVMRQAPHAAAATAGALQPRAVMDRAVVRRVLLRRVSRYSCRVLLPVLLLMLRPLLLVVVLWR